MPSFTAKDGSTKFSMNPQVAKAMSGSAPGMSMVKTGAADPTDPNATSTDDGTHVELHHGGNPQGNPPPTPTTKYHTIAMTADGAAPDIQNHDDYQSADQQMQQSMGENSMMDDDGGMNMNDDGGDQ